jgi:hypothetical protein
MSKKIIGAVIALIIVVGGYFYATPYIAINNIKKAAEAGDSETVSKYIDYPSVRQSFKDQLNAMMAKEIAKQQDNEWAALGAMFASAMVEKMVDGFITPEGMTLMLQGKDLQEATQQSIGANESSKAEQTKAEYETHYTSLNNFEVIIKDEDKAKDVKVLMVRDGLSWKVNKIVVPLK